MKRKNDSIFQVEQYFKKEGTWWFWETTDKNTQILRVSSLQHTHTNICLYWNCIEAANQIQLDDMWAHSNALCLEFRTKLQFEPISKSTTYLMMFRHHCSIYRYRRDFYFNVFKFHIFSAPRKRCVLCIEREYNIFIYWFSLKHKNGYSL